MGKQLNTTNNFLLYTNENGEVKVDVLLRDETIWLTINQMAELFGVDKSGISRHIKNVYETGELNEKATVAKIATVQKEGEREVNRKLEFFKVVQNKLIYAATGNTAAEVIAQRSDVTKDNMGLTTWKGGKVRKQDVTVSKNYLNKEELDILNRIITMYLDYAELQAKNHRQMFMKDWRQKLDAFLQFNNQEILQNAGTITKKVADKLAEEKYDQFQQKRLASEDSKPGDIDEAIKKLKD